MFAVVRSSMVHGPSSFVAWTSDDEDDEYDSAAVSSVFRPFCMTLKGTGTFYEPPSPFFGHGLPFRSGRIRRPNIFSNLAKKLSVANGQPR